LSKWPASNPGIHGYDEWHATEASASSSTTNCGCVPQWKNQGNGCITGGGVWKNQALECTNYWEPTDLDAKHVPLPSRKACRQTAATRGCVANLTTKIEGDDSQYMMDVFEDFLKRKSSGGSEAGPWYAHLSIHTNHVPHPALPEWFHAYKEAEGGPAGDYHGTISQMDAAIGRLTKMLKTYGAHENTMVWFSAGDNGAHTGGRPSGQNSASNGLRQCKASIFEGGIRVGGFVQWPSVIKKHTETKHTAVTMDFIQTILELLDVKHPHPDWFTDGMSLLPLLKGDLPLTAQRTKPIGFALGSQIAWLNDTGADGVWKIVYNPEKGQCSEFLPPYGQMADKSGPFLFNLVADPTESHDVCSKESARCAAMKRAVEDFKDSIQHSRASESQCDTGKGPTPRPPSPTPPSPTPPSPRGCGSCRVCLKDGKCQTGTHAPKTKAACEAKGSTWCGPAANEFPSLKYV